ncbi:carboxylesterase family protein [Pedobacter metabolipauper]|uniref:Putative esterase n=1 Tax=Pedobacter metabolipauper TaxID=425513 RepID=A0A4R6T051_9SPHI|nr:alpha/beta hydrolase-fold protein [Pedobacter metabolipauper]TDQ11389.1 putative esterase [Pedobacter metabolipauper]
MQKNAIINAAKMQLKPFLVLIFLSFCSYTSFAQDIYYFKTGLSVNAGARYGREALYTDPVAYSLYTKTWVQPADGMVFGKTGTGAELKWTKITADTANRFRGRGAAANYVYFDYNSPNETVAILNIRGNSAVYVNEEPHAGDPYSSGWLNIPVKLKKGKNDVLVRGQNIQASLTFPAKPIFMDVQDATLPYIIEGKPAQNLKAAVVVINTTAKPLTNLQMISKLGAKEMKSNLQTVPAYSTRKVYFSINGEAAIPKGINICSIALVQNGKELDLKMVNIESVSAADKYINTFVSNIDGSLQYYAVAPKVGGQEPGAALFLSVHGAGVEAIGQAKAYQSKDWGDLVTPTNRRPRGFNWEDWGRLDALEVLDLAKKDLKPNPQHIYLTGHSMGGHGTWFLGATYPDKWAAIAPCAGYPTLKGYGSADGLIPDSSKFAIGQILLRSSNQSDVPKLAYNYKQLGVYILHGDADETVSVNYARQMKQQLASFQADLSYYEYPGGSHWYGDHSVDWKPIFDFFKWHKLAPEKEINTIDFTTASPGISASNHWISIHQQVSPLNYSRVKLTRNLNAGTLSGSVENVQLLKIKLADFGKDKAITLTLDGLNPIKYTTKSDTDSLFIQKTVTEWTIVGAPGSKVKGPHRYGTFKEGFNKNMVYVYATGGTKAEQEWSINKARFDAETWYYRGNGAIDIISDKAYSKSKYAGRNVVLIGNSSTNAAWKTLLGDCPIKVTAAGITAGNKKWTGGDLGTYFIWPIAGTESNTVSVISGSGINGMNAVNANQYFAGGSGFPDIMIYRLKMLVDGANEVEYAGFYDNEWNLSGKDLISKE